VLVGSSFWDGLRRFGRFMVKQGVFAADELGFGHVTDSPRDAVDRIVRAQPPSVRARLSPSLAGLSPTPSR
jgi:predicted Rossmann-fold nucleotide-binding protein